MEQYPGLDIIIALTITGMVLAAVIPTIKDLINEYTAKIARLSFVPKPKTYILESYKHFVMVYNDETHKYEVYRKYKRRWRKIAVSFVRAELSKQYFKRPLK